MYIFVVIQTHVGISAVSNQYSIGFCLMYDFLKISGFNFTNLQTICFKFEHFNKKKTRFIGIQD